MTSRQSVMPVSHISKLLLENDLVKVYEVSLKPGETNELHSHPNFVLYNLTDTHVRNTDASGKVSEREYKAGQAAFVRAQTHMSENIGNQEFRVIVMELKK